MSATIRFGVFIFATMIMNTVGTFLLTWTCYYIADTSSVFYWYLTLIISCCVLAILILTRVFESLLTRILYYIVSIYWSLLIYFVIFIAIFHIINAIHKLSFTWGLCIVIIPSVLLFTYGFYNSFDLDIVTIDLPFPNMKSSLKIVHISDLHLGPIYGKEHVSRVVKEIRRLDPDLVAITGDIFDGSMKVSPDIIFPFNKLNVPIFLCLGNHDDVFLGMEEVKRSLQESKIVLLQDEMAKYNDINILGINYGARCGYLPNKLRQQNIKENEFNILLYHAPAMTADDLESFHINLHLGGHTHGGQMMPLFCNISPFKYARGLHRSKNGNTYVHISVGTGTAGPSLRMFSKSTIALLNIHP